MMRANRSKGRCPTCREEFLRKDARKAAAVAADGPPPPPKGSDDDEEEDEEDEEQQLDVSDVRGSWGTKVTALVAEVLRLPPDDKCLVFSEWDEVRVGFGVGLCVGGGVDNCRENISILAPFIIFILPIYLTLY
jgi:hypothetical protein